MGYWGSNTANTKAERINELISEYTWENKTAKSEVIMKRNSNSGVWILQKITDLRWSDITHVLSCNLMYKSDGQWMVKSISTDMGPAYYDCPKSIVKTWLQLNRGKRFVNDWEENWYNKWKHFDELYTKATQLGNGDDVMFGARKVTFKYWANKSGSKMVGKDHTDGNNYRWHTGNITEIL